MEYAPNMEYHCSEATKRGNNYSEQPGMCLSVKPNCDPSIQFRYMLLSHITLFYGRNLCAFSHFKQNPNLYLTLQTYCSDCTTYTARHKGKR
jgi:hypothetical protein